MGGVGADAYICHIGRSVSAALDAVSDSVEAARRGVREMRATLHAADSLTLEARVNESAKAKNIALERELINVDLALDRKCFNTRCRGRLQ